MIKKNLEGILSLRGFDNLEKFICPNNNLIEVNFSFCPKITKIDISHNEVTSLNLSNNPELRTLHCWENHLSELDLSKCTSLRIEFDNNYLSEPKRIKTNYSLIRHFNCQDNKISSLKLPDLPTVTHFNCSNNELTKLDFLYNITEEFERIINLDISGNKFPPTDLIDVYPLKNFVNLEELNISNNLFYGSLEVFQNLTKLRELKIRDTDINWGLQYLPESVCHVNTNSQNKDCLASKIWGDKNYHLSPTSWKKDWENKSWEEKIKELESRLKEQSKVLVNLKSLNIKEYESNEILKQLNTQLIQRLKVREEKLNQVEIPSK